MKTRRFRSFAKVNLGLEVVGKLPGGYHELRTLFAALSLHDTLDITETRGGITVRSDHKDVPGDETNLAHRAAVLIQKISGKSAGVSIDLHKRIPVGGGLGGGSSNAATVLRALDLMWGLGLGPFGLVDAAKQLGADVPYFLFGGLALGRGRGDDIRPLDVRLNQKVVVVPGGGGVSTAAVFQRFGARRTPPRSPSRIEAFLRSRRDDREGRSPRPLSSLRNDLEAAALEVGPALAVVARQVRRVGRSTGAALAGMSGSGSSFFLLFDDANTERAAAKTLGELGIPSVRCSFLSRRAYLSRFEILG